ncbi:MAG TPA: condensation domain-containing protein, partial [Egibacteraceae bacterium]|nr:condensation domain-containing protein [Egibacteraceae bacterium]
MNQDRSAAHTDTASSSQPPERTAFLAELEASERFHRDNAIGRIFHPGAVSYRQTVAENSVHIVMDDGRIFAHVDRYSPVRFTRDGVARYAFWRITVHNVAGAVTDVLSLPRGQHSGDRCPTAGESIEVDGDLLEELLNGRGEGSDAAAAAIDHLRGRLLPRTDESMQHISFNLVDEVIHLLDTPAEPWSVQLEVRVTGRLDERRLREALGEALRRHPLARVRKAGSQRSWNRSYWEAPSDLDSDPLRVEQHADEASLNSVRERLYSVPVPLSQSPPLRVVLVRRREGDTLMLNLHHAATDGIGGLRLLYSIARAYTGEADLLPHVDLLAVRDLMGRHAAADAPTRALRYLALVERLRELVAPPARLTPHGGREEAGYGFHHVRLSAEETQGLADFDHAGNVNDVLVAALHLAVASWNEQHGVPCR